ncbi:MAG: ATP-binding protein [Phycisphaerae bacterium]
MKELVIISGKGGTGKTSITAAFASLAERCVLADCDVDAADLHLIMKPQILRSESFSGGSRAEIQAESCLACARCAHVCRFDAISLTGPANDFAVRSFAVDPISCEGCGVCERVCPAGAIKFAPAVNGQWFESNTRFGTMLHAKLGIAEENSGKLVSLLRKEARITAEKEQCDLLIVDGSPGIGCPVIASVTGADLLLIVTEPTLSGLHDLQRVAKLAKGFGLPAMVCVNKADINPQMTERICEIAAELSFEVAGKIPYDNSFTAAQIEGQSLIEYGASEATHLITRMWRGIEERLEIKHN